MLFLFGLCNKFIRGVWVKRIKRGFRFRLRLVRGNILIRVCIRIVKKKRR